MNSRSSGTTVIRRVAIYVLDEHPDERLSELRKIAAEHNWEVTGEYVDRIKPDYQLADKSIEFQPGEAFRPFERCRKRITRTDTMRCLLRSVPVVRVYRSISTAE